jgi:recombination protein RecR
MGKEVAGPEIDRLIQLLARLPGLGPRSARRAALHLIRKRNELLAPLADALQKARETIVTCHICGNADSQDPCTLCRDVERDPHTLIVVETVADLWALERAGVLSARYHVLGGTLSPLDGIGPKDINLTRLIERVASGAVQEVILAVSATVDGQATAHYITGQLAEFNIKITRLALGVPVGGELDYLDDGTLAAAIQSRTLF